MRLRGSILSLALCCSLTLVAQDNLHARSSSYQWPEEPEVVQRLHQWQDLKFGILLHWGVYSVPGICESWTLTSEDWITPDPELSYDEYKKWYWGLSRSFNPTHFDPHQWARAAQCAGMKYAVFTTKHHDGFCLWDTKQTDYSVTHSGFAGNPQQDVVRHVFDAFRSEGMMMGAYFSKPDWHSPLYWWPARATYNRMHNYPIQQYPERWKAYKSFVYNQIEEIVSGYGPVDILWLDGGWCTAPREDIGLDSIVQMARGHQPGLIVVERACPGKWENYQTPEQTIPGEQILNPWESCITLTDNWGWDPHPRYKSVGRILSTLCEIVAKGGSLLLGVGPRPDGLIEEEAVSRMEQMGRWLERNGRAIYETMPIPTYRNPLGNVWFTASKDGLNTYALVVPQEDGNTLPARVTWQGNRPRPGGKITDLATGRHMRWKADNEGHVEVEIPEQLRNQALPLALHIDTDLKH